MDQHAQNTLIAVYGDRVEAVARKIRAYKRLDIPLCDLVQTGIMCLLQAAETYDPTKGTALWTWAEYRVRGSILNSLDDMRRLPRRILDRGTELVDVQTADEQPRDRLSLLELSSQMTTMFFVTEIQSNEPSPENDFEDKQGAKSLWDAVEQLPARERTVIELHFRGGVAFVEIAKRLGIDKSGVSRLYKQAARRLRAFLEEDVEATPQISESPEVDSDCGSASSRSDLGRAAE